MLQGQQQNGVRTNGAQAQGDSNAVLYLLPMNGTFERKTIGVPFYPEVLRIGRQTNAKTLPTPMNGYFDSKVLSRQHAEVWADRAGKIWIRDVKSSNGTFVNGQRLSGENRDSEPHELREQDVLELGIDIVSEDQKTVVHHKVAARVEHAGLYANSTNVMDLNFGDIDPTSGGGMMAPSLPQSLGQTRGRAGSQGSVGSSGRVSGPSSIAGSNIGGMGQPRHMNFWLTPITMEQIVRKLTVCYFFSVCPIHVANTYAQTELKAAKQQSMDLQRTSEFFDTLLTHGSLPEEPKSPQVEPMRSPQMNGAPVRLDQAKSFSEPPAPPPQQPLPEKPDSGRGSVPEPLVQPSLKRTDTERPHTTPASKGDSPHQIVSLVEALASARKELDSQGARVRDLEEILQKERMARADAEDRAQQLEKEKRMRVEGGPTEQTSESLESPKSASEMSKRMVNGVTTALAASGEMLMGGASKDNKSRPTGAEVPLRSAAELQQRIESMESDMNEMRQVMESHRRRAEMAEEESASTRKSLAEMVEKIRQDDAARDTKSKTIRASQQDDGSPQQIEDASDPARPLLSTTSSGLMLRMAGVQNGKALGPNEVAALEKAVSTALAQSRSRQDHLIQSAPYASIIGVVVIGMGVMAFLNGWQKVDR